LEKEIYYLKNNCDFNANANNDILLEVDINDSIWNFIKYLSLFTIVMQKYLNLWFFKILGLTLWVV